MANKVVGRKSIMFQKFYIVKTNEAIDEDCFRRLSTVYRLIYNV